MELVSLLTPVKFSGETRRGKTPMRIQIFRYSRFCPPTSIHFCSGGRHQKAADPDPLVTAESDYILKDFHFVDGESLPELKLHYRTIASPQQSIQRGGEECGPLNSRHYRYGKRVPRQRTFEMRCSNPDNRWRGQVLLILPDAIDLAVRVSQ